MQHRDSRAPRHLGVLDRLGQVPSPRAGGAWLQRHVRTFVLCSCGPPRTTISAGSSRASLTLCRRPRHPRGGPVHVAAPTRGAGPATATARERECRGQLAGAGAARDPRGTAGRPDRAYTSARSPDPGDQASPPARGGELLRHPARCDRDRCQHQDRGHRRPGDRGQRLRRHPGRASAARRRAGQRCDRLRAAGAAAQGRDHHRGHGQRPGPHLHRAVGQDPARPELVPQRRARPAHHRPDHHAHGPPHRRDQPTRRCTAARRLACQRDHRAAVAGGTR